MWILKHIIKHGNLENTWVSQCCVVLKVITIAKSPDIKVASPVAYNWFEEEGILTELFSRLGGLCEPAGGGLVGTA